MVARRGPYQRKHRASDNKAASGLKPSTAYSKHKQEIITRLGRIVRLVELDQWDDVIVECAEVIQLSVILLGLGDEA